MIPDQCSEILQSENSHSISIPLSADVSQSALESGIRTSGRNVFRCTAAAISFLLLLICCGPFTSNSYITTVVLDREMEVTIPPGFKSGEQLPVQVPGFGTAMLAVPPNSKPGESVVFNVPDTSAQYPQNQEGSSASTHTYSVTLPKTSLRQIIASVPGIGEVIFSDRALFIQLNPLQDSSVHLTGAPPQVTLSVPPSLARTGGPLYFTLPDHPRRARPPSQQLSSTAADVPPDISQAISKAVSSAVQVFR